MALLVIDYKSGGNLFSLLNSLDAVGAQYKVSSKPDEVKKASKIIFPGVGSYKSAMQKLDELRLKEAIQEKVLADSPFLGICVGMQVLFDQGEENGGSQGLGLIPGSVDHLEKKDGFKIPHMGWNQVRISSKENPLFKGIEDKSDFYFVHSYAAKTSNKELILKKYPNAEFSETQHSEEFISSFWNGNNLFSAQFHPEKRLEARFTTFKKFY